MLLFNSNVLKYFFVKLFIIFLLIFYKYSNVYLGICNIVCVFVCNFEKKIYIDVKWCY